MASLPCTLVLGEDLSDDPISTLRPLLKELIVENNLKLCVTNLAPMLWNNFTENLTAEDTLDALLIAVQQLERHESSSGETRSQCFPGNTITSDDRNLKTSLSLQIPPFFYSLIQNMCTKAFRCWIMQPTEKNAQQDILYWEKFKKVMISLNSLQLFNLISAYPLANVLLQEIEHQISRQCSKCYDVTMLETVTSSLSQLLLNWLQHIVGDGELNQWTSHLMYSIYEQFAKMRIQELFEIIVDYPESEPALQDLALCMKRVALKHSLIYSLDKSFRKRLLHPGVNTADIITQYVSAVKALRLVDPSGVVLEKVCGPVREYLYNREDTVRCIIASLTNDCDSELAEALIKGENNVESEEGDQNFYSWEPDPVDANPDCTAATRKSSDIISLLVNIYGSCEMFVSEYRNLLADRLLQMCSYDISREVCTLELLKHRFGENSLHFCEVMLKDIGDSKRIYGAVSPQISVDKDAADNFELKGMILSSEFWPAFREETFQIPASVQRKIEWYSNEYCKLKGMRKLSWKMYLGMVDIEILCGGERLSMTVSPIRAVLLHQFQLQGQWNIDALTRVLKAQPSIIRKHIGFWVSQGLLKELSTDEYILIQEQKLARKGTITKVNYEDESVMDIGEDSMETELQVYWNYITHMLTNLGSLSLERIHSMLGMFGLQGNVKKTISLHELKQFLQKKIIEQQLMLNNGSYSLVQ